MPSIDPVPRLDPRPDPVPSPRHSMLMRFRRIMAWMAAFAIVVAAIAVLLVARGDEGFHPHMLVATALGVGLTVLLATGLMSLVFLSSSSGHDDQATGKSTDEDKP
jgi:hypothetical protein